MAKVVDVTSMNRLQKTVTSALLALSRCLASLHPLRKEAAILERPMRQGTEGSFCPTAGGDLRPLVHEPVRSCILTMTM